MGRPQQREDTVAQVKPNPFLIALHIGKETDEERDAHHKDQMEIGEAICGIIQPQQTGLNKVEQRPVVLFVTRGINQEFSQKQRNRQFVSVEWQRQIGMTDAQILKTLQRQVLTIVKHNVQQRKRLEQLLLILP